MEIKKLTCIQCPLGCDLTVSMENGEVKAVSGQSCRRGEVYAKKEITAPTRTVTSTVALIGGVLPVIAVKTKSDIPKDKIFDCMKVINESCVSAPVSVGDVVVKNICDTGVDLVATASSEVAN